MQQAEFNTGVIRPVECFKEGWELIKDQYWLLFAITLVGMLIAGIIPIILLGPMMCGIYLCFFQKFDRKEVQFEQLFKGFDYFAPGLVVALFIVVPIIALLLIMYIPLIGMAMSGARMNESEMWAFLAGTLVTELIFAVVMVCIHTLLMFAFPLIVDRKLSAMQAIKTSIRAVFANLGGVVGLFAVGFVVGIVGYLLLCVGFYLAMPIIMAGNLVAYRKIFPPLDPQGFNNPPPPNAFQGAGSFN